MEKLENLAQKVVDRVDFLADKATMHLSKYNNLEKTKNYIQRFKDYCWSTSDPLYGDSFWVGTVIASFVPNPKQRKEVRELIDKNLRSKVLQTIAKDEITYYQDEYKVYRLYKASKACPWVLERKILPK